MAKTNNKGRNSPPFVKLWIVCDVDSWKEETINSVISRCDELKINYAFSNPCSEIWILCHQEDFDMQEAFESSDDCKKKATALLVKRGSYSNLITKQQIGYACNHAEAAHRPKSDKWPQKQGTHIYRLVNDLIG